MWFCLFRNVFRGHGINVSEKWKECLGNETECQNMEMQGPPEPQDDSDIIPSDEPRRTSGEEEDGPRGSMDAPRGSLGYDENEQQEEGAEEDEEEEETFDDDL